MMSVIFRCESWSSRNMPDFSTWNSELDYRSKYVFPRWSSWKKNRVPSCLGCTESSKISEFWFPSWCERGNISRLTHLHKPSHHMHPAPSTPSSTSSSLWEDLRGAAVCIGHSAVLQNGGGGRQVQWIWDAERGPRGMDRLITPPLILSASGPQPDRFGLKILSSGNIRLQ